MRGPCGTCACVAVGAATVSVAWMSSSTTLFQVGGDDAVRPTVIPTSSTLSSSPTYAKSSRTLKVNSILYPSPLPPPLDGILLHTPSFDHARVALMGTGAREDARGLEDDKREAWKRRRKKGAEEGQFGAPSGAAGLAADPSGASPGVPSAPPNHISESKFGRHRTARRPIRRAGPHAEPSGASSGAAGLTAELTPAHGIWV